MKEKKRRSPKMNGRAINGCWEYDLTLKKTFKKCWRKNWFTQQRVKNWAQFRGVISHGNYERRGKRNAQEEKLNENDYIWHERKLATLRRAIRKIGCLVGNHSVGRENLYETLTEGVKKCWRYKYCPLTTTLWPITRRVIKRAVRIKRATEFTCCARPIASTLNHKNNVLNGN